MQQRTLAQDWDAFDRTILMPVMAGSTQRRESRRAFYAGAWAMFSLMTDLAGPDDEPDEIGADRVEQVYRELKRYAADLEAGRA